MSLQKILSVVDLLRRNLISLILILGVAFLVWHLRGWVSPEHGETVVVHDTLTTPAQVMEVVKWKTKEVEKTNIIEKIVYKEQEVKLVKEYIFVGDSVLSDLRLMDLILTVEGKRGTLSLSTVNVGTSRIRSWKAPFPGGNFAIAATAGRPVVYTSRRLLRLDGVRVYGDKSMLGDVALGLSARTILFNRVEIEPWISVLQNAGIRVSFRVL